MAQNKNLLEEWFASAGNDERTIEAIFSEHHGAPNSACFLSQQMAEKYLKGYLAYHGVDFPKIHQLTKLLSLAQSEDKEFESLNEFGKQLSEFYITTRYPGDYEEYSWQDAEEAFAAALKIKNFVLERTRK